MLIQYNSSKFCRIPYTAHGAQIPAPLIVFSFFMLILGYVKLRIGLALSDMKDV